MGSGSRKRNWIKKKKKQFNVNLMNCFIFTTVSLLLRVETEVQQSVLRIWPSLRACRQAGRHACVHVCVWVIEGMSECDWVWGSECAPLASNKALAGQAICLFAAAPWHEKKDFYNNERSARGSENELLSQARGGKMGDLNSIIYQCRTGLAWQRLEEGEGA